MAVELDAFDEIPGRKVRREIITRRAPRRWRTLDTIACEGIARLRAQRLLDEGKILAAVSWLQYANGMMVRNNVSRLLREHGAT